MRPAIVVLLVSASVFAQTVAFQDASDPKRGRVSGVVQNEQGQPLPGAMVQAMLMGAPIMGKVPHALTDSQGRFALAGLLPGRTSVDASKEEDFYPDRLLGLWDSQTSSEIEVPSGGEVSGIVLKISPAGRLEVKARNAVTGADIDAITIRLERDGPPDRWIEGSRLGNQWLVPAAPIRLRVQTKGFQPAWYGGDGSLEQAMPITVSPRQVMMVVVFLVPKR
ncbi:MAG TPA: carboxypeptidase-like regulatory domain-containing protein [Bryobacteraceae bacterium]|nr:carboxypeptidase-like regulatory domain-containing protein [Bryobacteraceae bacterium]